jgi:hypothetical protein
MLCVSSDQFSFKFQFWCNVKRERYEQKLNFPEYLQLRLGLLTRFKTHVLKSIILNFVTRSVHLDYTFCN